jgi:4-hydroxy-tetrahydrodipicolinate reductase
MGLTLIRTITETEGCVVSGALEAPANPDLGQDGGTLAGLKPLGVTLTDDPLPLLAKADALVDFTAPKVSVELAALSGAHRPCHRNDRLFS